MYFIVVADTSLIRPKCQFKIGYGRLWRFVDIVLRHYGRCGAVALRRRVCDIFLVGSLTFRADCQISLTSLRTSMDVIVLYQPATVFYVVRDASAIVK